MDRLLGPISELRAAASRGIAAWDRFWFTPSDSTSLGLLRILAGWMILYTHLVWGLELDAFFGNEGWQDPLLVREFLKDSHAVSFWWLVPVDWIGAVHWTCIAILVCNLLGFCVRATSVATMCIVISYANRVPLANFGLDQINGLISVYLAIAYAFLPARDSRLTLDRWICQRLSIGRAIRAGLPLPGPLPCQPSSMITIATRLVQIHVCIIYFGAGLSKLKGYAWWDGTAVWIAAANQEYQSGDLTWLAWYPYLINIISLVTVVWEMSFFILVWRPALRPWVLLIGMSMHMGIGAFLGMWTFGLIMEFTYVAFIPPESLQNGIRRLLGWKGLVRPSDRAVTNSKIEELCHVP